MSTGFSGKCCLHSLADTQAWAQMFAGNLHGDDVVGLNGNLGAGKTFLVQNILSSLGCHEEVTSPTFALINTHHAGSHTVYHWDFYRMQSPNEALEIGWMEMLTEPDAIHLIEWAERFSALIPATAWWISLEALEGNERKLFWKGPRPLSAI